MYYINMATEPGEGTPQEESQDKKGPTKYSRKEFLKKLAGAGIATVAGMGLLDWAAKETFGKVTPIPESEKTADTPIRSPYFWSALAEVRKKHPEQEAEVRQVLEKIDEESFSNIDTFQAPFDPDLKVPFTKVTVNKIFSQKLAESQGKPKPKDIYVIYTGFAVPPGGNPFTTGDMLYNDTFNSAPAVILGHKDVDIYSVGFPQGLGGQVSAEYLKAIQSGTAGYGQLFGAFIKEIIKNNPGARVVLHGMSFGSTVAELSARQLNEAERQKVQLLLDNPAADHGLVDPKVVQVPVGFGLEAFIRGQFDPRVKLSMEGEAIFYEKYKRLLSEKGIEWEDDQNQSDLKREAMIADGLHLIKGIHLDTENNRLFIRKGIWDPTSFSKSFLVRAFISRILNKINVYQRGKSLVFGIGESHYINRFRVEKWCRILKNFVK